MTSAFIYFKFPFFEGGSYFQEFIEEYSKKEEKVYIVASPFPSKSENPRSNIKMLWVPLLKIRIIEEPIFMLLALLKSIFIKELHNVDTVNSIGPRGILAGWFLKKLYGVRFVCTIELLNEPTSFITKVNYLLTKFLITKAPIDMIICWSNYYWKNHLKKWGIKKEQVKIIPGGINFRNYNYKKAMDKNIRNKYAKNNPLIVFAKPLYDANAKSASIIIEALLKIKKKHKVKLLIGSGPRQKEVALLVKKLGLENQVSFMPPVSFTDIPSYLSCADLIVLPFSYAPTTSRSLVEAMAMRKPIITSPVGEIGTILKDRVNALFVAPNSLDVARGIKELLNNKALSKKIADNAYKLARERFDLDNIVIITKKIMYGE